MNKRKIYYIAFIFIIEILFQLFGGIFYDALPVWYWSVCDASMLIIPVLLGITIGLIGCIPNIIAEIIWYVSTGYIGTLLHGLSFLLIVVLLGVIETLLEKRQSDYSPIFLLVSYEISLVLEELFYMTLRVFCGASGFNSLTVSRVSVNLVSVGNIICLIICVLFFYRHKYVTVIETK